MSRTTNRRALKGAVAAVTGAALLLGGMGTFALWSADQPVNAGTVTTGQLRIQNYTPGEWTGATGNVADFRMVPGDTLTRTDTLEVIAYGDNLVIDAGLVGVPANLPGGLTATVVAPALESLDTTSSDPQDVDVTITVSLAADAGNPTQQQAVNLSGVSVTLNQVAPPAA